MNNPINLDKNFFFGGNSTFTVESEKTSLWKTFKFRRPKTGGPFFASLLAGRDNENDYAYIGIVNPETGDLRLTQKSRRNDSSPDVITLRWFLKHLFSDGQLTNAKVHHEGKCGCCGRKLTVPDSIKCGIGPECIKKFRIEA